MVGRSDVYKQVLVVEGLVLAVVVHEGGVLQQPQLGRGDAAAQPRRRGRHQRQRRATARTQHRLQVLERFDAAKGKYLVSLEKYFWTVSNLLLCLLVERGLPELRGVAGHLAGGGSRHAA